MFTFAWPWLAVVVVLPALVRRWLRPFSSQTALRVPFFAAVRHWPHELTAVPTGPAFWLAACVWLAVVAAVCRPQWLDEPVAKPVSGRSLYLALDISASMRQTDPSADPMAGRKSSTLSGATQSRLDVVRAASVEFIRARSTDRVGLIVFGSRAYVQCPLTFDRDVVVALLNDARAGLAGELTALGDAIGIAVKRLRSLPATERVLVLVTDGSNTAGVMTPDDALRFARNHGVRIHTIGIGPRRAQPTANQAVQPSALDEATLRRIASSTGGNYFHARSATVLNEVYQALEKLEPTALGTERLRPVVELFRWPLALALLLTVGMLFSAVALGLRRAAPIRSGDAPGQNHA